ncbi:hypothetical protein CC79DRAFT_1074553 [Sarocladium strictum]
MSEPQRTPSKGHTRNKSSIKASRPRSSTKGPLDIDDDPLTSSPSPSTPSQLTPGTLNAPRRSTSSARSPPPPASTSSPTPRVGEFRPKDFSFLLRPEIYHPLTPLNVPAAFRNSGKQPNPEASVNELLAKGHFRAAAIAAVQELTGTGHRGQVIPQDAPRIFSLLYTRLACLTLIDATSLAAQEVKALEDLNARTYIDDATGEHLVPWELRVLNVRLQALGFGDSRRAVMSYHELAREAREHISKAMSRHDNSARELWKARLHDLGIKVAGALIEMDDLAGASHHLASLPHRGDSKLALSKALLWLQLGDADMARECAKETVGGAEEAENAEILITALCDMADGEYEASLANWERLQDLDDEMVATNTAVCLLYLGRMSEGRTILEKQIESGRTSHTLLFNLSTMYELCTEKNRALKMKLAEKVAGMDERPSGWEKSNSDFKL